MEKMNVNIPIQEPVVLKQQFFFVQLGKRNTIPALLGIVLICFIFPFCELKCNKKVVSDIKGYELMIGKKFEESNGASMMTTESREIKFNIWALGGFLLAAAGLYVYRIRRLDEAKLGLIMAGGSSVSLWMLHNSIIDQLAVYSVAQIDLSFKYAYWIALISSALAALLSYWRFRHNLLPNVDYIEIPIEKFIKGNTLQNVEQNPNINQQPPLMETLRETKTFATESSSTTQIDAGNTAFQNPYVPSKTDAHLESSLESTESLKSNVIHPELNKIEALQVVETTDTPSKPENQQQLEAVRTQNTNVAYSSKVSRTEPESRMSNSNENNGALVNSSNWVLANLKALLILSLTLIGLAILSRSVGFILSYKLAANSESISKKSENKDTNENFDNPILKKESKEDKNADVIDKQELNKKVQDDDLKEAKTEKESNDQAISYGKLSGQNISTVKLFSEPNKESEVIDVLKKNIRFEIIEYGKNYTIYNGDNGKWCKVKYEDQVGWVWCNYIKEL